MQGPFASSFLSHGNFLFEEKIFLPVIGNTRRKSTYEHKHDLEWPGCHKEI